MSRLAARWGEDPRVTQGAFGAAFVLGVLGILGLKSYGVDQLWVTLWPAAVLALYAALVFVPPFRLRPDQTGDNVYYLGFLFTLVSLGYSLYQFNLEEGLEGIVQNFGIAISSTIAGVFGRVLLNQMRTDPYEVERAVRITLTDSARALRGELDNAVIEFNGYRRHIQQSAADGVREVGEATAEVVEKTSRALTTTIESSSREISSFVQSWTETAKNWNETSDKLLKGMADLSSRLENVRAPHDIISEKLSPAAEAVEKLSGSANTMSATLDSSSIALKNSLQEVSAVAGEIQRILESTDASAKELATAAANLRDVENKAAQSIEKASELTGSLAATESSIADHLGSFSSALQDRVRELSDVLQESAAKLHAVQGAEAADAEVIELTQLQQDRSRV